MHKFYLTIIAQLLALVTAIASNEHGNQLFTNVQRNFLEHKPQPYSLFEVAPNRNYRFDHVNQATYLQLRFDQLKALLAEAPQTIKLSIPSPSGNGYWTLDLYKTQILSSDFSIKTSDGKTFQAPQAAYYQGIFNNDPHSMAVVSVFEQEIMGMLSNASGNYDLGKIDQQGNDTYMLYRSNELAQKIPFNCNTSDEDTPVGTAAVAADCRIVRVYLECDFDLYTKRSSSVTNVNTFVTGIFNQVAAIYTNESIQTQISEIFVWTSTDPYISQTTSSTVLSTFRTTRTTFNGNIAHLLSTRSNNMGGIAYLDVICGTTFKHAYSNIYNSFNTVPTYSWTVNVFTHEMGHNLGSNHTQWCGWTGGALDNCYTTEGGCAAGPAPVGGGTIMSYCHLVGGVGVNLANGFGTQPGNKIRTRYLAATCLNGGPTLSISPATATICSGSSVALTASGSSTTYSWTPTTGLNVSNAATVTASPSLTTTYTVSSTVNNCTSTATRQVTVLSAPAYGTLASGNQSFSGSGDPSSIGFSTSPSGGAGTFSYQWYSKSGISAAPTGSATTGWTLISGATSSTYDPGVQTASISFAVMVNPTGTPDCGGALWANGVRQITINPPSTFVPGTLASGNQTFCSAGGDPSAISFSTLPSGSTSYAYQWYFRNGVQAMPTGSSTTNWSIITGATSNSYDPPATLTQSRSYACIVTPSGGTGQWASGVRQITVLAAVVTGTLASGNQTFTGSGDPASISLTTAPSGGAGTYSYQWYSRLGVQTAPTGTSTTNWTAISGATSNTFDPGVQNATISFALQVNATGSPDCGSATWASGVRVITINPGFSAGSLATGNQTFCNTGGDPVAITFATMPTGGATISYQWYFRNGIQAAPTGSSTTNWSIITGATSSSYDPPAGLTQSRTYACLVTPSGGTAQWASEVRQITVLPAFNPGSVTVSDESFCGSGNPSNITMSVNPTGSGAYTWRWYYQESASTACPTGNSITGWLTNTTSANISGTTTTGSGIWFDPISAGTLNNGRTFAVLITPVSNGAIPACGTAQWATNCRKTYVTSCAAAMENEIQGDAETAELEQSFPNPTSDQATIVYSLPSKYKGAKLMIYDRFGRPVKAQELTTGSKQTIEFSSQELSSGLYYYSIEFYGTKLANRTLVLMK